MTSPARDWDDVEDGYKKGQNGIYVNPLFRQSGDGMVMERVVEEDDANAWGVAVRDGLGTAAETHNVLTRFRDVQTAWEFAHLLTHFVNQMGSGRVARSELMESAYNNVGGLPQFVEAGESAEDVFREALAHREYRLDNALE